jgi:hypothetical protein
MPCFRPQETADMSCEQRLSEIAAILARGVLRLCKARELGRKNLSESAPDPLDAPAKPRLSVTTG